jgi:chemotaxis protein CheZ
VATVPFPVERRANARHLEALAAGLQRLSASLTETLEGLPLDARLAQMAGDRLPDASARLEHVIRITDEAAHRTLDLVEKSRELMDRMRLAHNDIAAMRSGAINRTDHALARVQNETDWCTEQLRRNLGEMAVAQGYQDLTGQIIRKVVRLVTEVEQALVDLLKSAGLATRREPAAAPAPGGAPPGPAVPGRDVAASQKDADDLLSNLGL